MIIKPGNSVRAAAVILIACLASSLSGCSGGGTVSVENDTMTMSTPRNLRMVPEQSLALEVSVGSVVSNWSGGSSSNGQWLIPVDLEDGQTYDLRVRWFSNEHLLVEETGQIFADPDNRRIVADLDVMTQGADRFDSDCDGRSNLDEIMAGTEPGPVRESPCLIPAPSLPLASTLPYLSSNGLKYAFAGVPDRITRLDQVLEFRKLPANDVVWAGVILQTDSPVLHDDGSMSSVRLTLKVVMDTTQQQAHRIVFFSNRSIATAAREGTCLEAGNGHLCALSFDAQRDTQYQLSLVEVSPFTLLASVVNLATDETFSVGTIQVSDQVSWAFNTFDIGFEGERTVEQCNQGFDAVTVRFNNARVNDVYTFSPAVLVPSECVRLSGSSEYYGWGTGTKETVENPLHYFFIGD